MINLIVGGFWQLLSGHSCSGPSPPVRPGKMPNTPFVSIIIPARNEAERISALLRSLQEQNFRSFEVLVIDDDSTDDTVSVASAFDATILRNESKEAGAGKSSACWHGVQHSKGKWLLFLDADTRFSNSDSLRDLLALVSTERGPGHLIPAAVPSHRGHVRESFSHLQCDCCRGDECIHRLGKAV